MVLIIKSNWMTKWFERLFKLLLGIPERDFSLNILKRNLLVGVSERSISMDVSERNISLSDLKRQMSIEVVTV